MREKKYLRSVIGIAKTGEKQISAMFYRLAIFAAVVILALSALARYFDVFGSQQYFLLVGFFLGVVSARASSIYNFRYIYKHVDVGALEKRLKQLNA